MKKIGKIANVKGLKGEVKILSSSDFKEERFKKGNQLFIKEQDQYVPLTVTNWYVHKNFDIVKFKELNYVDEAQQYLSKELYGEKLADVVLQADEFFHEDLLNNKVYYQEEQIGIVIDVFDQANRTYLKIKKANNKKILYPFIKELIERVDNEQQIIYLNPIEGLLDD
ncbi:MAG: ribosome maturation factor RimM [Mycoplasmatales bacterium]